MAGAGTERERRVSVREEAPGFRLRPRWGGDGALVLRRLGFRERLRVETGTGLVWARLGPVTGTGLGPGLDRGGGRGRGRGLIRGRGRERLGTETGGKPGWGRGGWGR